MILKPIGNRILVRIPPATEQVIGGLYIPAAAKANDATVRGSVIECGVDVKGVVVGNEVIISSFSGTEVKVDDVKHLIVDADNVLAVVE